MFETVITTAQVKALRREAAVAGDISLAITCDIAMGVGPCKGTCVCAATCGQPECSCADDSECPRGCLGDDGYADYSGGGHDDWELPAIRRAQRLSMSEAWAECASIIAGTRLLDD